MAQKQRAMEERKRLMEEAGKRARVGWGENGESKEEASYRSSLKTQENSGRYDDSQRYRKAKQN